MRDKDNYRLGKLERTLAKADLLILDDIENDEMSGHQSKGRSWIAGLKSGFQGR